MELIAVHGMCAKIFHSYIVYCMIIEIMTGISLFLTILYYTFLVMDEIWKSPVGKAFKDWYEKTQKLPNSVEKKNLLLIN